MPGRKVYVHYGAFHSHVMIMFQKKGWDLVSPNDAEFICWTGGSDISPSMYNETPLNGTFVNHAADKKELALYHQHKDKKKLGICKGGQMLNAMNGGKMWQDVDGHEGSHPIIDLETGKELYVSSLHHQAMIPGLNVTHVAIAQDEATYMKGMFGGKYQNIIDEKGMETYEVLWYPNDQALCYQPHPELNTGDDQRYFFSLIERFY